MRYIDTLFPRLAESGLQLELFYEVKANLRHDQLVRMHRGGVRQIQPGIESFSDAVLRLMDKGVTGFQNIQLLRGLKTDVNAVAFYRGDQPGKAVAEDLLKQYARYSNGKLTWKSLDPDREPNLAKRYGV